MLRSTEQTQGLFNQNAPHGRFSTTRLTFNFVSAWCEHKSNIYFFNSSLKHSTPGGQLVLTPNRQIGEMLHYIENIFNTYYCEIRFIVFHFNAGRYHVKFCFSSKTRVSHFRKSLETA